jgi:rfaE bifunctional protein nucleotidyltransferase chain/domain/rfaE bifunctional protein kinase chain/domain
VKLVVVGDALLDVDIEGTAERLCPDAPAPVLEVRAERTRPGGAALAAALAAADGVDVTLVSAVADDEDGERLRDALGAVPAVLGPSPAATPVKTRLRSGGHSLARLDRGGGPEVARLTDRMLDAVRAADLVLVSDYGRGLARDPRLRAELRRLPVVWDPHPRGPQPVPGARLVTPNLAEALDASGEVGPEAAASVLRERWGARAVVVTLGAGGALLDHGGTPVAVPAPRIPVVDPCGAGDRFAVTAAARLMAGAATDDAVAAAVDAAAEFLSCGGASGFGRTPAPTTSDVDRVIASTRARGGVVVATGGCFDLLHAGHARTLAAARALGDCLVVCLNSDRSVRRLKGPDRPHIGVGDRKELLCALGCVDAVAVFDEDTPNALLARLRPDVWVKGGDYSADALPEADLVRGWGGRTVVVPYHQGRSTTLLSTSISRRSSS